MEEKNKKQNEAQENDNKIPIERINTTESPEEKETVEERHAEWESAIERTQWSARSMRS